MAVARVKDTAIYTHNYMKSHAFNEHVDAMYIPATLSLEYDLSSRWTAGVFGRYSYLPLNKDLTPKGMYSAGVVLPSFVSKVMPSNKARYYKALRDQAEMKEAYEKQLAEKQRAYDGLSESLKACRKDNAELQSLLDDCEKSKKVKSYEVFFTVDKTNITTPGRASGRKFISTTEEQGELQAHPSSVRLRRTEFLRDFWHSARSSEQCRRL